MINLTLIVQIINFWIAYFILTRILFKPAYDAIMADEQQGNALERQIGRVETTITEQSMINRREWTQLQGDLQKQLPEVRHEIVKAVGVSEQPLTAPSEQEIRALVAQTRTLLVKRVSNDTCR